MISVKSLRKQYGSLVAVRDLSFDVERGQIVGLLGHNGAGKTTVMKVMTGFLEPTSGTITVGGKDVRTDRIGVQSQIGYMPENAPLYDEMLVQEYLVMMAELRGIEVSQRRQAVIDAITDTGLSDRAVQQIGTLSKGYRQRVGLAQAILHKPDVLVLDEPTNGLDPVQILEIRTLIQKLAQTATVIISTHILSEIEAVCNEVVILIDGELAAHDSIDSLLSAQQVKLTFTTTAPSEIASKVRDLEGVEVEHVSKHDDGKTLLFTCRDADELSRKLMALIRKNDWQVTGLAPVSPSLETIFRNLMSAYAEQKPITGAVA
jgi:ABC-2 type transport system ATP-binding protein